MSRGSITRRDFIKLLGIGTIGGVVAACAPKTVKPASFAFSTYVPGTQTPLSSETPEPVIPTHTEAGRTLPDPTYTSVPTRTSAVLTPTPLPDPDVLTEQQKLRLSQAALQYVADNEPDAIQIARSLGYIENDGHPASVCGPLAIAILRDAGLLSKYTDLHAFWLLNPRDSRNQRTLERTFPPAEFLWFKTDESIASFDYHSFPLKPGDFLYLYAGDPGSFEHMLAVSRIDEMGRAFAVTNFDTPEGYVIREVILYDPDHPGMGKFYEWTDRRNFRYGLTGFGGFDLWRFQVPVVDQSPLEITLTEEIDKIIDETGGNWYLHIKEVGSRIWYSRLARDAVHPASVIKVPIAMLFMKYIEEQGVSDLSDILSYGFEGRSYEQLLRAMLVDSEENATESLLRNLFEARFDISGTLARWGAEYTDVQQRISSARDIATLYEGLYGEYLQPQARQLILTLLSVYTPGDDTRLGVLKKSLPMGYHFYNKRGTITEEFLTVADCTLVEFPFPSGKRAFVIAAFGFQGMEKVVYEDLVRALEEMAGVIGKYAGQLLS